MNTLDRSFGNYKLPSGAVHDAFRISVHDTRAIIRNKNELFNTQILDLLGIKERIIFKKCEDHSPNSYPECLRLESFHLSTNTPNNLRFQIK